MNSIKHIIKTTIGVALFALVFAVFAGGPTISNYNGSMSVSVAIAHAAYGDGGGSGGGCCGGGGTVSNGGGGSHDHGNPPPVVIPAPACVIVGTPSTVASGGSTVLTFNSSNTSAASISGIGSISLDGNTTVANMTATRTFVMTVSGPGGSATCQTTVTVTPLPPAAPSCSIASNPSSITLGGSATVSWTSANATAASTNLSGSVGLNDSHVVSPDHTTTYILTVTGAGGSATCQTTVTVTPPVQITPSCSINASPANITQGNASILSWSSSNAVSASLSNTGSVSVSGNQSVVPSNTTTYTLTVTSSTGQSANCQVTVTVNAVPAPSCSINASPTNLTQGNASILSWSSSNAVSASLTNVGSVSVNGNQSVVPSNTTSYTLTVTSSTGQTATCATTVNVTPIIIVSSPSCSISASQNQLNYGNNNIMLSWTSGNAVSANLSNIGSVSTNGSQSVYPTNTTTYTLTVYGQNGQVATCATTVTVNQGVAPSCWINISMPQPSYAYAASAAYNPNFNVNSTNNTATLTWGSNNATSAYISNVGNVSAAGTLQILAAPGQNYSMNVYSSDGHSANCVTSTAVLPPPPPLAQISCSINASPSYVQNGQSSNLTWTSNGAVRAALSDGIGYVAPAGSVQVTPGSSRSYVLTIWGVNGETRTCTTVLTVGGSYVTLTQIPYTGLDFGSGGNAMYWSALMVFAVAASYLVARSIPAIPAMPRIAFNPFGGFIGASRRFSEGE